MGAAQWCKRRRVRLDAARRSACATMFFRTCRCDLAKHDKTTKGDGLSHLRPLQSDQICVSETNPAPG